MTLEDRSTSEEAAVLKLALSQYEHVYDNINNSYDQLRVKALSMIAGELALGAFIFSTDTLVIPTEYYGIIFYFAGIISFILSFGIVISTITSITWKVPGEPDTGDGIVEKYPEESAYLKFIIGQYVECIDHCMEVVDRRTGRFNWALYLLSGSAIMLLIIKFGGNS